MQQLEQLRSKWVSEDVIQFRFATDKDIVSFEKQNNVCLPDDFKNYLKLLNGTGDNSDDRDFQFYSICEINSIDKEYQDWKRPNYSKIIDNLPQFDKYYVFANYSCHMFSYVIRLSCEIGNNDILIVSDDKYKKITNSFLEFVELYLIDSIELYFSD